MAREGCSPRFCNQEVRGREIRGPAVVLRIFHNDNQSQDFLIDAAKIKRKKAATFPAYDHRNL